MDRGRLQDSDGVNESFWDGLGVEFEARYFLEGIWGCGGSRRIENFSRIRMVLTRASGTDLASSLKRNTFLTLGVCPVGGPRGTGGHAGAPGRGDTRGPPGRGDTRGPRDGGHTGAPGRGIRGSPGTGGAFMRPNPPGGWGADGG